MSTRAIVKSNAVGWRKGNLVKLLRSLPLLLVVQAFGADTALDRYVKKSDASYKYEVVGTTRGEGYTTYVIDLTSQTWRQPSEVDRTVWKHWLTLVKPDHVAGTTGFLFITRGSANPMSKTRSPPNP
jgi:PhoPQ-activated pathogenicity-related protein